MSPFSGGRGEVNVAMLEEIEKTTSQCTFDGPNNDFENMFLSKSERTKKCLQSWYDNNWKCRCSYSK